MSWNIYFFETNRGGKPVKEFIRKQNQSAIAKIAREIDLLAQYGIFLSMPHSKRLDKKIYELRIRGKEEIRILYGFNKKDIYLLHAFKKQTQATPSKEINTALQRLTLLTLR